MIFIIFLPLFIETPKDFTQIFEMTVTLAVLGINVQH